MYCQENISLQYNYTHDVNSLLRVTQLISPSWREKRRNSAQTILDTFRQAKFFWICFSLICEHNIKIVQNFLFTLLFSQYYRTSN